MPPRIHNLVKLVERTTVPLSEELKVFLDEVTDFNLEVRYPGYKKEFQRKCTRELCENVFVNKIFEIESILLVEFENHSTGVQ